MELCRKFVGKLCMIQNDELMAEGKKPLFNNADLMEIVSLWSMTECVLVTCKIGMDVVESIEAGLEVLDEMIMPWCIFFNSDCESCTYGERHGICDNPDSDYKQFLLGDKTPLFYHGAMSEKILELIQNYHGLGRTTAEQEEVKESK